MRGVGELAELAGHQVGHLLADVDGVVADPLDTAGDHQHAQAVLPLVGAICAAIAAWFSVKFLMRYFETNTLMPFAIYCFVAGGAAALYFALT